MYKKSVQVDTLLNAENLEYLKAALGDYHCI